MTLPLLKMHKTRWSVFFGLLGLTALIPAYFIPSMLVANAVDGSRWLSIWTGITTFWERQHYFLAGIIFCFSLVFPLVKLGLCLTCASGAKWLSLKWRRRVLQFTEWTGKYSMLDVFVIAMLILLVKVDEFILMLPSLGLYLFSFAVFCSVICSGLLQSAFKQEMARPEIAVENQPTHRRWIYLPWIVAGAALTVGGLALVMANLGGRVDRVIVSNLTKRPIPRTMERLIGLRELGKADHDLFSWDTLKRLRDALQAATTDAGWSKAQGLVTLRTLSGQEITTLPQPLDFDDPHLTLEFKLPEPLALESIGEVELRSRVEYIGLVPVESTEERVAVANDPFRAWTPDWYGRIFQFRWLGPPNHEFTAGWVLASLGLGAFYWAASGFICGGRIRGLGAGGVVRELEE